MLQLKVIETGSNKLIFAIDPKHVKLQANCSLSIIITDQDQQIELQRKVLYPPFQSKLEFKDLPSSKLIKVKYTFVNGNTNKNNNLFTFTKVHQDQQTESQEHHLQNHQPTSLKTSNSYRPRPQSANIKLSKTQQLMKTVGKINNVMNGKQLDRAILAARVSKNTEDFVKSGYKFLRPELREERLKRTILISHGIQISDTIYKHSEGRQLFKNDWFMGPFYSYDANERQMRRKN